MTTVKVITDNKPRAILDWRDLSTKEQSEFSHYRNEDDGALYVRYKGHVYDLSDMMRAPDSLKPWDSVHNETYFSGVLFRHVDDGRVLCGRYST